MYNLSRTRTQLDIYVEDFAMSEVHHSYNHLILYFQELESHSSQSGQLSEPPPTPHSTASQGTGQTSDPQKSDGKHFLGKRINFHPTNMLQNVSH